MRVEGQPNLSQDAGLLLVPNPGLIIGWVWEDWDDDGIQDDDEVGLDGVTLNLLSESRAGDAPRRRGGRTGRGQA